MSKMSIHCRHCLEIVKRRHPDWDAEKQEKEARRLDEGFKNEIKTGKLDMSLRDVKI